MTIDGWDGMFIGGVVSARTCPFPHLPPPFPSLAIVRFQYTPGFFGGDEGGCADVPLPPNPPSFTPASPSPHFDKMAELELELEVTLVVGGGWGLLPPPGGGGVIARRLV